MTALEPAAMVTPHVRPIRKIGEGGMGSVWAALHLRLDSEVAVKFIDPELIEKHPEIRARFRREATAAAKIKSPNVVRIFDHGEMQNGTPFIVMELLSSRPTCGWSARRATSPTTNRSMRRPTCSSRSSTSGSPRI